MKINVENMHSLSVQRRNKLFGREKLRLIPKIENIIKTAADAGLFKIEITLNHEDFSEASIYESQKYLAANGFTILGGYSHFRGDKGYTAFSVSWGKTKKE